MVRAGVWGAVADIFGLYVHGLSVSVFRIGAKKVSNYNKWTG
jgi:hypothetical protein